MVIKTVNTYAWRKAIKASRNIITVTMTQGKHATRMKIDPFVNKSQEKPINILSKAWPDIIFANNRILKLKTLAKYESISIKIKNGAIAKGTPPGKKRFEVVHRFLKILIILIPMKYDNAKKKVMTNELVAVNEYGIRPTMFAVRI